MADLKKYLVEGYLPTIGIECHVQLKTKTKLFSGADNDARQAEPNTLISHIDLGMPGALPVLNEKAVELASKAAFALNSRPAKFSKFDRKHYFYPDLPNGYQITQFDEPIVVGGHVDIEADGEKLKIGVTRAHLEADAGKSSHPEGADFTLVDLNRAGTPLLEIVSEPDIHSPQQAKAYARELYLLMRYAGVSDANLFYGNMRFDVNVSISQDPKKMGTRSETKNLNSFRSVQSAVEYEINRQIELLQKGQAVVQETRGWDDAKQKTFSQRSKEDAHDYRYFPDPDIPPVVLDNDYTLSIEKAMPPLPGQLRQRLRKLDLDSSVVETLLDEMPAGQLMTQILQTEGKDSSKRVANWLASDLQGHLSEIGTAWEEIDLSAEQLIKLSAMVQDDQISSTSAKQLLFELAVKGGDPHTLAKEHDLLQISDEGAVEKVIDDVIAANPQAAKDIKQGELKAIGFLVGQVMRQSKGKANPDLAKKLIKKRLGV